VGLLMLILSLFAGGAWMSAKEDLARYDRTINSPEGATEMFLRGFDRGMKGDVFGQYFEMAATRRALEADVGNAQFLTILALIATGICVGAFVVFRRKRPADGAPTMGHMPPR
jgi:hypothetical protein